MARSRSVSGVATIASVLVWLAVMLSGCKDKSAEPVTEKAPVDLKYSLSISHTLSEDIEIKLGDKSLGTIARIGTGTAIDAVIPDSYWLTDPKRPLTGMIKTSCGLQAVPLVPTYWSSRSEEEGARKLANNGPIQVHLELDKSATTRVLLWLDNPLETKLTKYKRGGTEYESELVAIKIGTEQVLLPQGAVQSEHILGNCKGANVIAVGDRQVGILDGAKPDSKGVSQYLVDLEGGHCYRIKTHLFTLSGVGDPPPDISVEGGPIIPIDTKEYSVDYFMSEPPDSFEAEITAGDVRLYSWHQMPCP